MTALDRDKARDVLRKASGDPFGGHRFDNTLDALAGCVTDETPTIDRDALAEKMALVDEYDGCFDRIREWEALPDWEREAHPDERPHTDYEDREFWRKRADVALALIEPDSRERSSGNRADVGGFDRDGFRADLLASGWTEWLTDEVLTRLEPHLHAASLAPEEARVAAWALRHVKGWPDDLDPDQALALLEARPALATRLEEVAS